MALEHTNVFHAEHALGRAVAKGFSPTSPRAYWIGPELCGQKEGSALVLLEGSAYGVSLADCSVFCALASTRPIAKISGQIPGPGMVCKFGQRQGLGARRRLSTGDSRRYTPVSDSPFFFLVCIWAYPDGARQLRRGAPRRRAPTPLCHRAPLVLFLLLVTCLCMFPASACAS